MRHSVRLSRIDVRSHNLGISEPAFPPIVGGARIVSVLKSSRMAKAASPSTAETHWWQRDPLIGIAVGWAFILAGAALGFEVLQVLVRAL